MKKIFQTKDGKQFPDAYNAFLHELTLLRKVIVLRLQETKGTYGGRCRYATLHLVGPIGTVVNLGSYGEGMDYRFCEVENAYGIGKSLAKVLGYEFNEEKVYEESSF